MFAVVVSAHWDTAHTSPGVNDNGSGVVALLEVARLLSNLPVTNTVIFAVLDKERAGGQGSKAFIRDFLCPLIVRQFRASVQVSGQWSVVSHVLITIIYYLHKTNHSNDIN